MDAPGPEGQPLPGVRLVGKIDHANLAEGILHEVKKSRAAEDAHVWQLRFYLWLLRLAGVARADGTPFTGRLDYPALRRTKDVALSDDDARTLERTVEAIADTLRAPVPPERPPPERRAFC